MSTRFKQGVSFARDERGQSVIDGRESDYASVSNVCLGGDLGPGQSSECLYRVEDGQNLVISDSDRRGNATCSLFVLEVRTKIYSVDRSGFRPLNYVLSLKFRYTSRPSPIHSTRIQAGWQSGYAADCNSVYAGSIPTPASNSTLMHCPGG